MFPSKQQSAGTAMMYLGHMVYLLQAIYSITRLGIPDILHKKPHSSSELAAATGAHPQALARVLRAVAASDILHERDGQYHLTEWGNLLRTDNPESVAWFVRYVFDAWHWEISGKMYETVMTGKTGYHLVDPRSTGFYDFVQQEGREEVFETFNKGVRAWSAVQHQAAVAAYDFGHEPLVLVDIGGGMGSLVCLALQKNPQAQGINFDQPPMATASETFIESMGLSNRCQAVGGNFFESVPANGDIYMISSVLMDHGDAEVEQVLRNIRQVMRADSKLLIVEALIGQANESGFGLLVDLLELLENRSGHCRSEADFAVLLNRAGLTITRAIPTGLPTIIEAQSTPAA